VILRLFKQRKNLIGLIVPLVIIFSDQITKQLIIDHFLLGETVPILEGFFHFTYVRNPGAAFGMLANAPPIFRVPFFLAIPVIALIIIFFIFKKLPVTSVMVPMALSLVIGGAVGNLIDRIRFGYVIDFLDFHWKYQYHFPAFNIADSAICIGVGILMIDVFKNKEADESKEGKS